MYSRDWKYVGDGNDVSWFNWQPGEPNNFMLGDEKCAIANFEWFVDFEENWADAPCDHWAQVVCQDTKAVTPAANVEVEHNGKTYTLMPSKSGNFEEVTKICGDLDLMMFEPRNQAEYDAVYAEAKALGMDMIYLNIQRENPESKFKFLSDNTEIDWNNWASGEPNNHEGKGENCVTSHFWSYFKGQWVDVLCSNVGQVICQQK